MRSRLTVAGLMAMLALLTLAGCGVDERSGRISGGEAPAGSRAGQDSGATAGKAEGAAPGSTGTGPATTGQRVTIQRARILTAELTVRAKSVDDVGDIADRAISLVEGAGGALAGDRRVQDGSRTQADVILKIPPAKYSDTLNQLGKLGKELQRAAQSQDVTDEVTDVASRVSSQTASVERIRKLLASARNLGEIVTIEAELAKRQAELESLQARQRTLDSQTADATITLHVKSPGAAAVKKEEKKSGFLAGLDAGWTAFTASVTVLLTVVGALLPFLVVSALALGVVWMLLRRRRGTVVAREPAPSPSP